MAGNAARDLSRKLIDTYFRTNPYPYTRHHIDSYDQFLQQDMVNMIKSQNPILILKELIREDPIVYKYRVEIFVGGEDGSAIEIGTPTVSLQNTQEVRVLFPNEARLRNLTYASTVYADIIVKITYTSAEGVVRDLSPAPETFKKFPLFKIPIMLHSRFCILNNKPKEFLREAGECPYDHGGYFIVAGAEKVLITRQEQAFNTLYITPQNDPKQAIYASIECLSQETRQVKRVSIALMRHVEREGFVSHATILVSLPFVRKPIPLFLLFRALGFQSDEEILKMIFPDFSSSEAKLLLPKLQPSIIDAFPFMTTYTAIQYIKTLTKGFSEAHVIDIIRNQLFIHMPNDPSSQALFLGECVRKILRVSEGYEEKTDRDDTRNQRCLTSGFLVQELFNNSYKLWIKAFVLAIGKEYNYNRSVLYKDEKFQNIFQAGNESKIFMGGLLTDMIMKGFKGKWGTGLGEEKSGVLQAMSRLSYVDFLSHCRRVILDFDTGMKLTGPRKLHTSQYGYFCTSETPTGASIGITKNLTILAAISTSSQTKTFFEWLRSTGRVYKPEDTTLEHRIVFVPVYVNGGMFGYTAVPYLLTDVLKLLKRCGCLPYSVSISFSIRDRKVYLYLDPGRPLRPLIHLKNAEVPVEKLQRAKTWKELVMGTIRQSASLETTEFIDPLREKTNKLEDYPALLSPHTGCIEYVDPYEQNECFIANGPAYITKETTHMEVHPSTIMSMMTSLIPFAPHNQSPRNQLSCSQSKQGLSIYATNWRNRFDNTAHVLCYGEMPITRTIYNNYLGEGRMAYGMNCILAIACWSGYNQEDGIVMNYDAVHRGMFRSMAFRSYEAFEEDDEKANTKIRFGNPAQMSNWKDLKPGLDYSKVDDRGIIREGEYVDENTVLVSAYMMSTTGGQIKDASTTPQVWTRGRVEKVAVMVNNMGLRLVKIRVVQDRIPELGDKFCLTEDHDVLTEKGWVPINEVSKTHMVVQRNENATTEYVHPMDTYVFDHTGPMYLIQTEKGSQYVTSEHRLYVGDSNNTWKLITANVLYAIQDSTYYLMDASGVSVRITSIRMTPTNEIGDKVYCLSVPSQIFLVRRKGEETAFWTGNSNRHGQKGTIGALLRGHDMPRTESGIVPDMIMNPHAIPSRMTIAQNLEQLLGKTAALTGAIGDGTSFMNDGSPQEAIGGILEQIGFEKYGNEVMYNGATGEQIQAAIFIGPVYGMRLKHMVEDKWQARGQGRKEMRTHQPTGGRGAQGGLKIGEMDRDAIIGHAGMAFVKESFMERSDGTKMPICVACGTIPIYNPKLNIAICSMCDGPVRYMGDSVHNLEILPPIGRPKSRIVEVEMPYSTKLLTQEQETYLNLSMRYITTSGIQRLTPLELSAKTGEAVSELPRLFAPVIRAPAYRDEEEEPKFTLEQLRSMGANVVQLPEEQQKALDVIVEENEEGENAVIDMAGQPPMQQVMMNQQPMQQMNQMQQAPMQQPMIQQALPMQQQQPMIQQALPMQQPMQQMNQQPMIQMQQPMQQPMVQQQVPMVPQNQVIYPPQQGGMPPPNLATVMQGGFHQATFPGQGGMIVVDTSGGAMAAEGLGPMPSSGGRRTRASYQGGGGSSAMQGVPPPAMPSSVMPSSTPSGGFQNITITKLE
uniref:DNA-directed RNA polymerase n=1 Tax=viral metagenome TaxID=1070528 RepID=A0A6C0DE19_9ZZZZ